MQWQQRDVDAGEAKLDKPKVESTEAEKENIKTLTGTKEDEAVIKDGANIDGSVKKVDVVPPLPISEMQTGRGKLGTTAGAGGLTSRTNASIKPKLNPSIRPVCVCVSFHFRASCLLFGARESLCCLLFEYTCKIKCEILCCFFSCEHYTYLLAISPFFLICVHVFGGVECRAPYIASFGS